MRRDEFTEKVAWITGAGSGIGRGTALRFAAEGARVVVSDVNLEGAKETVAEIEAAGGEAVADACDVTDLEQCRNAVARARSEYGRLDAVFANAGIGLPGLVEWVEEDQWLDVLDVNLNGVFRTAKAAMEALRESGAGSIVITSSIEGLVGSQLIPAYCAAKTGLLGLTRSLAEEGGPHNVRTNAVCPGFIKTPLTAPIQHMPDVEKTLFNKIPLGRPGEPEDIAGVVLFLCSDDARYITGQWLAVDGGMTATA